MNAFVNNIPPAFTTANGAATHGSSGDPFVNLFAIIGSSRHNPEHAVSLFKTARQYSDKLAMRILLWARDCRGGAGERKIFEMCIDEIVKEIGTSMEVYRLLEKIVEIGRYDDLFPFIKNPGTRVVACSLIANHFNSDHLRGLVAKWLPREKSAHKDIAKILMKEFKLTPKEYRRMLSENTDVVEQKMCAKQFDQIEYKHVPSLAMARYGNAFKRNDSARFVEYKEAIAAGAVKAKATSLFPHDLIRSVRSEPEIANAQWKELKNYIPEGVSILPIVDVSASMTCPASGSVTCMDVSVAVGLYLAEKQKSAFKDVIVTFESSPKMFQIPEGTLAERVDAIRKAPWGGSTNFEAAMMLVLRHAVQNNVHPDDMPDYLICCSDMEFNQSSCGHRTNFDVAKQAFAEAGYILPTLIFWQLNGRMNNLQVKAHTENTAMISGFSPAIMEAVLGCNTPTPRSIMEAAVMNPRYDVPGFTV